MAVLAAVLVIVCLECVVCNLPFWTTLAASTDTSSATNTLGTGLERRDDGMLVVTDQTQAYLDVPADGTSSYIRIDPVSQETLSAAEQDARQDAEHYSPYRAIYVRADSDGHAGTMTSLAINAPRSLYVKVSAQDMVRVWIAEPAGSVIPIAAIHANVRVPFSFDWLRVACMAVVVLLVAIWRPGSRLWKITLDTAAWRQRLALATFLIVVFAATMVPVSMQLSASGMLTFSKPHAYTYDFEQYGRVADALIHGHTWVDLPVDPALTTVDNPYDADTRNQLLADGVQLFWDYAYHDGHWYSYFGVLPAVLLFVPYQLLTGRMLPSGAAELLLMFGVLTFTCLLTIRLIRRVAPRSSLAATSLAIMFVLLGSNAPYLWFRTNFYSIPCAASLFVSLMGLWFWMGASMPRRRPAAPDATPLKLGHLAAGSACIAANAGCRPTFALVALLGIAMFWPQLRDLYTQVTGRSIGIRQALRMPLAVLLPALIIVVPLLAYNVARFGSPLDFGNDYQFTVTDMTRFTPSIDTWLLLMGYYLFLPLRFSSSFPFLELSPTPLPSWAYAEEMIGGVLALSPLLILAFVTPFLRNNPCRRLMTSMVALGVALLAFDAWEAGLGWRYMVDFTWLFALAALPAFLMIVERRTVLLRTRRFVMVALVLAMLAVTIFGFFVPGRDDALIGANAGLYHTVRSWFMPF